MKLIVGNWKMNGRRAALEEVSAVAAALDGLRAGVWLAPPATLIMAAADIAGESALGAGGGLVIGAQDCHALPEGAHTGGVSAEQLVDAGARFVILGHSERRADEGESDALVRAKAHAARAAGLEVIICVGETEAERLSGRAEAVVGTQLAGSLPDDLEGVIVAYEPVWAIGTGRVPLLEEVAAMHGFIRGRLGAAGRGVRILYGGSVKPDNAGQLMAVAEVGGALVGGASLKAASLLAIAGACG